MVWFAMTRGHSTNSSMLHTRDDLLMAPPVNFSGSTAAHTLLARGPESTANGETTAGGFDITKSKSEELDTCP
jgi:hypothetical protein